MTPCRQTQWRMAIWFGVLSIILSSTIFFTASTPYREIVVLTDMTTVFERLTNPSFTTNDFYTEASILSGPRMIYGRIVVGLSQIFDLHHTTIQAVFFFLEILIIPTLFFLVLSSAIPHFTNNANIQFVMLGLIGIGTVFFIHPISHYFFSLAGWGPLPLSFATPQALALMLGLLGIMLQHNATKPFRIISYLVSAMATIIHPVVGLIVFGLEFLLFFNGIMRHFLIRGTLTIVIPFILILIFSGNIDNLPTGEFVRIYTQNHPLHYLPSEFFSPLRTLMLITLYSTVIGAAILLWRQGQIRMAYIAAGVFILHIDALILQYVSAEIFTISSIIIIGPTRFHMIFLWILLFVCAGTIAHLVAPKLPKIIIKMSSIRFGSTLLIGILIPLFGYNLMAFVGADHRALLLEQQNDLTAFIASTSPESIFIIPPNMRAAEFVIKHNRPLFVHMSFVFTPSHIEEFDRRKTAVYGSYNDIKTLRDERIITYSKAQDIWYTEHVLCRNTLNIPKNTSFYIIYQTPTVIEEYGKPVFTTEQYSIYELTSSRTPKRCSP